jgi:hypothetical protein
MKVYVKQERLSRMCSLSLRIVDKDKNIIFRFFALIRIPHKKFNRAKFLLRNYKKLNFTLDIYDYREFNDFNIILKNNNLINYIFDNCFLRFDTKDRDFRLIKEWKQKNIINT